MPLLGAGARWIARQGLANYGRKVVLPTLAGEVASKTAAGVTGIPETVFDAMQYVTPLSAISNATRRGLAKLPGEAVARLGTNAAVDFAPEVQNDQASPNGLINFNRRTDRNFYRDNFNTPIPRNLQQEYQNWLSTLPESQRSIDDYDLAGYFMAGKRGENGIKLYNRSEGEHFIDKFKKPNHYTFSDQSMYSKPFGFVGGRWLEGRNGWIFEPGFNVHSREELQDYFNKYEPQSSIRFR